MAINKQKWRGYNIIVCMYDGNYRSYKKVTNLLRFQDFLREEGGFRFYNVFDRITRKQIANYTNRSPSYTPTVTTYN